MKIDEVYIQNFRGYGINKKREDGMYVFNGLASSKMIIFTGYNGFGKTSFFDAIEWCLTDKIRRLEQIEKTLMLNNLKKSHMLKYTNGDDTYRVVQVAIRFDNGVYIKRISNNNSLYESTYSSKVVGEEDQPIVIDDIIREYLLTGELSVDDLLRVCFCGQDNIAGLLRTTKATDRTEILMKLLGLSNINDLVTLSDGNKFRKLTETIKSLQNKILENNNDKKEIESFFAVSKWSNPAEYRNELRKVIFNAILDKKYEQNSYTQIVKELATGSITELLDSVEKIFIRKEEIDKEIENNNKLVNQLLYFIFLRKWVEDKRYIDGVEYIKSFDYNAKKNQESNIQEKLDCYDIALKKSNEYVEELARLGRRLNEIKKRASAINEIDESIIKEFIEFTDIRKKAIKTSLHGTNLKIMSIRKVKKMINKLVQRGEKYSNNIHKLDQIIDNKKTFISVTSKINNDYVNMLIDVRKYIISQQDMDRCPVCNSKNIIVPNNMVDKPIKEKILFNISNTIDNGNGEVEQLQKQLDSLYTKRKQIVELLNQRVIRRVQTILSEHILNCESYIDENKVYCSKQIECQKKAVDYYSEEKNKITGSISTFISRYKDIVHHEFEEKYSVETDSEIMKYSTIIRKLEQDRIKYFLKKNYQEGNFTYELLYTEYEKEEVKMRMYKNKISFYLKKKRDLHEAHLLMQEILEFRLGKSSKQLLERYEQSLTNQDELKQRLEEIEEFNSTRAIINKRAKGIQEVLLEILIKENPLILWIYNKINPHPYFRDFQIINTSSGINIVNSEFSDIYLDHIFSTAQVNVLALSIYLGIALSTNNIKLEQLYMDDPIQSMDDVNMLSYIDLVRMICNTPELNKTLIIATHDHNFSKLLTIKMRNYAFTKIDFISYGKEGPKIEITTNVL